MPVGDRRRPVEGRWETGQVMPVETGFNRLLQETGINHTSADLLDLVELLLCGLTFLSTFHFYINQENLRQPVFHIYNQNNSRFDSRI
jgi:hypothetical protein